MSRHRPLPAAVAACSVCGIVLAASLLIARGAEQEKVGLRVAEPASVGVDADRLTAIDERMKEYVDQYQASGVVTLVARDGVIVHHSAIGQADLAQQKPMRKDTIFAIASMTKPITATGLMILQDEGKLSIEDPVSKYIPEFESVKLADGQKPKQEMKIRHLLTHTAGLAGSQQNEGTLAETVQRLAERPLAFESGTKWQYSRGLTVCGRIIEVVSGQPYEEFLAERIFQPLKMVDTTFNPSREQRRRVATLYQPGENEDGLAEAEHWLNDLSEHRTPNPSGGLFSTAIDMARFYQMILNGGQWQGQHIISDDAVGQMTTIQTGSLETGFTPGNGWGLGWCVIREPQGVTEALRPGTFGHGGAFGTQGWVDRQRNMIYVLLIQRTNFGNSDGSEIRGDLHKLAVAALQEE